MKMGHTEKGVDGKEVRIYPTLTISGKDFPEVKDWKIDETVELIIKCKVSGVERLGWQTDRKISTTVEITDMRKNENKEGFENEYARKRSNAPRA